MAAWGQQDWNTPAQADQGGRRDRGQGGGYGGGYGSNRHRDDNRRRGGGGQFPQAAHNPYDVRLPHFLESIAECEDDDRKTSIIMVDTRDERIVSPFQAWLVREIMTNSSSSVNVLTERDQVMPPNSGYHLSLFANYTLDGVKATVAIAIDSQTGSPCGGWDDKTARALSHVAFQPFTWPVLRDTSPSYTDVKVYNGNEILFHWIFRGYRADTDLSVQQQFADEFFIRGVRQGRARLSVVVAAFSGWRVSVFSFECGGRTYAIGPNGTVIAGDSARSRFELRVTDRSSDDAVGNDADRVEFRYRDANNRIDLKCARTSVPATWLTVSHISGPTLIQTISRCRDQRARVEGPEQTEQFAQLAAAHKGWWHDAATLDPAKVGVLGSPRSWQHGRSPRCHMMGRPWLQFLVDRRRLPKVHGRQQPTRPMLWPMCRRVLRRWQSAAGHKTSSRPARSPRRSTRSTTIRATRRTPGATSRTQFGTRQGMTARSPGPQPSSRLAELTGPGSTFGGGGRSAAPASTAIVREVMEAEPAPDDPQNLLGPIGEPTSFKPHRTP